MSAFLQRLKQGQQFEQEYAGFLLQYGCHILDTKTSNEKPTLHPGLTVPDRLACFQGRSFWVECKAKERMRKYPRTGFATYLYHHYQRIEQVSGLPVLVVFKDKQELYGNWLANLHPIPMLIQGCPHTLFEIAEMLPLTSTHPLPTLPGLSQPATAAVETSTTP